MSGSGWLLVLAPVWLPLVLVALLRLLPERRYRPGSRELRRARAWRELVERVEALERDGAGR